MFISESYRAEWLRKTRFVVVLWYEYCESGGVVITKNNRDVKKFITLSMTLVGVAWMQVVEAQNSLVHADSVLLSDRIEGDYEVRRYQVSTPMEADYALHYAISSATLNPKMGENPLELDNLKMLMNHFQDTLHQVEQIHITGYASPDGPDLLNDRLAKQRAENVKGYVGEHYATSQNCPIVLTSAIAPWSAVREKLAASKVEGRDEALKIIDSSHTSAEKQQALKAMPAVWAFLAREALPPLRRVEVDVNYKQRAVVTTRVAIPPKLAPKPTPTITPQPEPVATHAKVQDPCCEELLRSETLGIIVAMPTSAVDY